VKTLWFAGMLSATAAAGCAAPRPSLPLIHLEADDAGGAWRLTLVATAGARINARLKPVLELPGGSRVTFDSPAITPDSGYFTQPPVATLTAGGPRLVGTLRVGVCHVGLRVCRAMTLAIDQAVPRG